MLTTVLALLVIAVQVVIGYLGYSLKVEWEMLALKQRIGTFCIVLALEYTTIAGFIAIF
jgi:hypothetical protein